MKKKKKEKKTPFALTNSKKSLNSIVWLINSSLLEFIFN